MKITRFTEEQIIAAIRSQVSGEKTVDANGKENLTHYGEHKLTHLFLKNLVVKKSKKRCSKPVLNSLEF